MAEAPPSVLMVSAGFHPAVGGAERQALELSKALRARGVGVMVATRRLPGLAESEQVDGVPVHRLWCAGGGALNSLTFQWSLCVFMLKRAREYHAVHVHLAGSPAVAAALMGRLLDRRVFVKLGGGKGIGELAASSKTLLGKVKLLALRLLRPQFAAVAKELAAEAALYLGSVPVHVLPNGVDTKTFAPVERERKAALRAALGWPTAGIGFVYVGRLSPEKQLPWFLDAWLDAIKKTGRGVFLAFVGDGVEERVLREAIARARAVELVYLKPAMREIAAAYAAADVFVLPSVSEGLSNALLEAMSSGLAVLGSRVGGTAEAVVHGENGFLFAPTDRDELLLGISRFLEHPELAASMGQASRRAALSRYAMEKIAESWEHMYSWGAK
jgi:glycosyltransferase involved in cell wall biosynthesis